MGGKSRPELPWQDTAVLLVDQQLRGSVAAGSTLTPARMRAEDVGVVQSWSSPSSSGQSPVLARTAVLDAERAAAYANSRCLSMQAGCL